VGLVSGTIARWDAHDTSRRLGVAARTRSAVHRINGTVVGGLAGLVLHALSSVLSVAVACARRYRRSGPHCTYR